MISLSTRAKEAIKIALAITIAMGIALWMDWEKPYWAAFAVAFISLPMEGQSLNQGAMRMLGTLVSVVALFTFLAWFPQQRWWFMTVVSLYVGFCAYMMTGKKRQYFWYVSGFVCIIIASGSSNSLTAFQTAVERTLETGTGILVYSLISALLWPRGTRGVLEDASCRLLAVQGQLYRACRGLMRGEGRAEDTRLQRMQGLRLLKQVEVLLDAAETDSYEVWEVRHQWRLFHQQSTALMEALGQWRTSLPEIEPLDQTRLLPNLEALYSELDLRFSQIERMLDGQAPDRMPQAVTLDVDKDEMRALTHFQVAAVVVTKSQLDRLEALSRSLFECVRDLRGYGGSAPKPLREETSRRRLAIDPDRLQGVVYVLVTVWASFLIWVYVDPPGGASFWSISTVLVMMIVRTGASPTGVAKSVIVGTLFAGLAYIFVMPHLSSYVELGMMIFCATFAISYVFSKPYLGLGKTALLAMFARFITVQNEQTYSFLSWADGLAMMVLVCALLVAASYIPTSPRPEKVFLRLLRRFFRHAEFLISGPGPGEQQLKGIAGRWRANFYQKDLLQLPAKISACAQKIDYRAFPANTPEQVQAMVSSLYLLAFRIKDLVEVREQPQAQRLVQELIEDLGSWRDQVAERFRLRADDPGVAMEPEAELEARLTARLARMEAQIDKTLHEADEGEFSTSDYANFYRLLGSYRGLVEEAIGFARLAARFDWARWQEARF